MLSVLLPTDFSHNAENAIHYAVQLLEHEACTFYVFNAYTPVIYHVEYVLGYPAQFGLGDVVRDTAQKNLDDLVSKLNATYKNNKHQFKSYARFDTLVLGIKEFVAAHHIDIIVMGTKGATGAKEVLFGSNTVHIFNEVRCPVLAVPSKFSFETPHEILFPTDLEVAYKEENFTFLKTLVASNHARLNVLNVSAGFELNEKQNLNKEKLGSIFKNTAFLFHQYKSMELTHAINEFQVKHKINLLVMVNNKHSFFENLFFRKTINQIGFHLNIPFLVLPSAK
ncbi:universal stress protein [Winogradskyella sediminis]|uniref:Nucleotide-binding universal stress protein, UspA family n=1 Tax=Winogradskyella sediminis TaxID=1382466 RepID=A0A1H1MLI2_9FLAO|nr:universal stress protein [Winogradskyella sediminis]SDR87681.1 Nucleotide-binding universal stress protein, UspA family [Winogradskyella sediminis]